MGGAASIPCPRPNLDASNYAEYSTSDAPHFVMEPGAVRPIRFSESGPGSSQVCPTQTLVDIFRKVVEKESKSGLVAMRVERGLPTPAKGEKPPPSMSPEKLTTWTYKSYYDTVCDVACAVISLGFEPHDAVCMFGFNCPEWFLGAYAGIFAGGCFMGIYPSDTSDQVVFKAKLSNSSVAFVENNKCQDMFISNAEELPVLKVIINWGEDAASGATCHVRQDGSEVKIISFKECVELGKSVDRALLESRMNGIKSTDCCDLIFTSGTTGNPKAVMISHDSVVFETYSMSETLRESLDMGKDQRILSYLPLSHIAGSLADIFIPLVVTLLADEHVGCTVTFARPYDLKMGTLKERLLLTRPTLFMGVPRVWEKIQEGLIKAGSKSKGLKKKLIVWAKTKGLSYCSQQQLGGNGVVPFGFNTAEKLLLSKVKALLGLDQCMVGYTGAAPIKLETLEFFGALNIQINELYGMSETTGLATLNTPDSFLWGSVGFPLPGVEVAIFSVQDKKQCPRAKDIFNPSDENEGEICFRGRNICMGYMANSALGQEHVEEIREKNSQLIDQDGWLHSGDKGCKGDNNMIRITGRFKELIIGAGGENIAPVPIENSVCKLCTGISNIIMVGDERKFNVALISLKAEGATGELPGTENLNPDVVHLGTSTTISQAMGDAKWIEEVTRAIVATNKDGTVCPSNASTIQKFAIVPHDFSVLGGEMTATLKIKRGVVEEKYADLLEDMYTKENASNTYIRFKGFDAYK